MAELIQLKAAERTENREIPLSAIIFDDSIYPRKEHDPALVQRYAESIESIEAAGNFVSVSSDYRLLDGKHRWLAYRKAYESEPDRPIPANVYPVKDKAHKFALAVELNSQHGYQLSAEDKKRSAIALYSMNYSYDNIARCLSVSKKRISEWLSRTVKEEKSARNEKIFDLWLASYTQEEIAKQVGLTQKAIAKYDFTTLVPGNQSSKTLTEFAEPDFAPPIYNIWKQQDKTPGVDHFGNSEIRWLDYLLYLYTQPFDTVVDPFAGSGSTATLCQKRLRRYWVSDRKPVVELEHILRRHDITEGVPALPRWKGTVKLVYLDPPYWKQAEGQYSNDPTDLANMDLETFHSTLANLIQAFAKKLDPGAVIALIIQPTQWKADNREFVDHVGDLLRRVKLTVNMRYSVPYESQQCTAQMVNWAKQARRCLVLTREIIAWRV